MNNFKILSEEPMFWSRIGWTNDPTRLDEKGNVIFDDNDWTDHIKEHEMFLKAGVRVHTSILHNGWVGVDKYDYSAVDKTLDAICGISEDILYMPRIKLNPPLEWCLQNPEDVSLTFDAPRTPEKIKQLIKKLKDYYVTSGIKGEAPDDGGYTGLQSFSSDKWIKAASVALKKLIEYIENGKYGNRIAGYQIGFGMCAETCWWGGWSESKYWGDYGNVNSRKFYEYCLKIYGSKENTEKAFGRKISVENIIPHYSKRKYEPKNLEEYFRVGCEDVILYSQFVSDTTADAICSLARVVKECVPDKPVGTFYGYITAAYPTETGHIAVERLLQCDDIDFIASPKGYYRSGPGEPGGTQATSMSVSRTKLWLDELDNDTHITTQFHHKENHPKNFEETRTVLWREVLKNLSWNNQNFWWMDLYGGWFMDDEIMAEIEKLTDFVKNMREKEYKSISEILLVLDEKSLAYQNCDAEMMGGHDKGIINELCCEAHLCGAPVDECRLSDLKDMNLSQYKMIIFANAFVIDDNTRKIIKNISKSTLCIWNYAAGIRNAEYNIKNVEELTGMEIEAYNGDYTLSNGYGLNAKLPPIQIKESDKIDVIERYDDGAVKTARYGNNILAASPNLYAKDFYNYAKESGCHMYAPYNCTIYADNRFIGIFPKKSKNGDIIFAEDSKYREEILGNIYNKENNINLKEKTAMVFKRIEGRE